MMKKWAWCVAQEKEGMELWMILLPQQRGNQHSPFGETGTLLVVCSRARGKTIKTLAPWLIVGTSKGYQTLLFTAHKPRVSAYNAIHIQILPFEFNFKIFTIIDYKKLISSMLQLTSVYVRHVTSFHMATLTNIWMIDSTIKHKYISYWHQN